MNKRLEWVLLPLLAVAGIFLWCKLELPRYQSLDLSVDQAKAVRIADDFLKSKVGVDANSYRMAVSFDVDEDTDRYLQKTLGIAASQQLISHLHYDLFYWVVRFFRERQKEEFKVIISSATGEVIAFSHTIDDTAARPATDKEKARQLALDFLKSTYGFDPDKYVLHGEEVKKFDNRQDYAFSWQDKDVNIPWSSNKHRGSAKLLTEVTVSGNEILAFDKFDFEIPDGFNRYVDNLKQTGQNLSLVFRLVYIALLTFSVVVVVNRKNQVVFRSVKPFYIGIGTVMFVIVLLDILNSYQSLLFDYPTSQSLGDYMVRQFIESIIGPFFTAVAFVLPAMAGESLRFETAPAQKNGGILNTLLSSFCSVNVGRQLLIGYCAAALILGLQACIYNFGFKYCGVWDELSWLTQASTSVLPAFTALAIGFQASFSEEGMFRLFAINLLKRYGAPTAVAVVASASMWGFGHTAYEIFPMWFRGLEVTSIGIVMGIFYLRYGFICVVAAHFVIDSFLSSLPYFLKPHLSFDLYSSLAVVGLPLVLAVLALVFNRNTPERPLSIRFNAHQEFNYNLLKELCTAKTPEELAVLKKDLQRHGWDAAIIQRIFEERG